MRYLQVSILYVVVYLGAGALLGQHPLARLLVANTLLLALAFAVCVAVLRRRRDWDGTERLFWCAIAAGMAMWCIGQIGFTIDGVNGQRSWVRWHTMFSLCGGIGPLVALLARPYLGPRKSAASAVRVDLITYAMLIGFVFAYFIMVPSVVPATGQQPQAALLSLVQAQRLLLALGTVASVWFAWQTPWRNTFMRLAAGAVIGYPLRLLASGAIESGRYQEGGIADLAWIVPFGCYLWAAHDAPRSEPEHADVLAIPSAWRSAIVSSAPVLLIPILGFGLLRVAPIGSQGESVRLLITVLSTVTGLGVLTLRLSLQSGELQRADARIRMMAAATEQTADLILITRGDGTFEHANDACVQALGYSRAELAGMTLAKLLEPGFHEMVDRIGREVRRTGMWRGTIIHRRKNGSIFPASSTVVALRNPQGRVAHFVGVQRDITEELKLRDQLVHSERLSAVGTLVAGVAHELNNPLQTVLGCVELMLEDPNSDLQRDLRTVRQEAARAGQIVRSLLAFVRRGSTERAPVDLNQIARSVAELCERRLADRRIALHLDLHPEPLPVIVNREEIQQVILNLAINAEHALGEAGGAIRIATSAAGGRHRVQVVDDGPGISQELRGKIFEPFFTTKQVGEGTGLGLSIALGIATAHGGKLELCGTSAGACFQLTLPAAPPAIASESSGMAAAASALAASAHASPVPAACSRLALVVDDEAPIRAMLARMLSRRGFEVTEAGSRAEVTAVAGKGPFDLVLCDVKLGDGNGADVLNDLRRRHPEVHRRFVFVTGDAGLLLDQDFGGLTVLAKPFTGRDLDRVLTNMVSA